MGSTEFIVSNIVMRKSTEIMYNKTIGNMRFLKQCTGL